MFQEILDWLNSQWEDFKLFHILYDYECGVIYRMGILNREMHHGINWKIPFFEKQKSVSAQDDTKTLSTQTVGDYVVTPIVTYYVKNVRKYYTKVLGSKESIVDDLTAAVVTEHLERGLDNKESMLNELRDRCATYGLRVRDLNFSTKACVPTVRLILDRPMEQSEE